MGKIGPAGPAIGTGNGTTQTGEAIEKAAEIIRGGGLVAFPTESFYGLGADVTNTAALERLFRVKRRGKEKPILALIPGPEVPSWMIKKVPRIARRLMDAFWPGGLTLVFEAADEVSALLTAGTGKIGLRCPGLGLVRELARAAGVPLTGTSANISGERGCVSAAQVFEALGRHVDVILDHGTTPGREGSTVLDVTSSPLRILRQGMVRREDLERVAGAGRVFNPWR